MLVLVLVFRSETSSCHLPCISAIIHHDRIVVETPNGTREIERKGRGNNLWSIGSNLYNTVELRMKEKDECEKCPCNKMMMIKVNENWVCPHMRKLNDEEQIEWQELNKLPAWLCKIVRQ